MRRILTVLTLAASMALAGCQTLGGGSTTLEDGAERFANEDAFREWFAFYYKEPRPGEVPAALGYMRDRGYLKEYPDVVAAFLAQIFVKEPGRVEGWMDAWQGLRAEEWDVVLAALWLADTEVSRAQYARCLTRGSEASRDRYRAMAEKRGGAGELLTLDVEDPRQVNVLWAAFSASGDLRYVRKVIGLVRHYGDQSSRQAAIGEAAIMTLANSALLHEPVAALCVEENEKNPDAKTRVLLGTMLSLLAQIAAEAGESAPSH